MEKPIMGKKKSKSMLLDAGTYYFCSCGKSTTQPYCDGSHSETSFKPKKMTLHSPKEISICQCKHSSSFPYCDGSHKTL